MELGEFSEMVAKNVSQDVVFSKEETPYLKDTDYCAFYATQAALKHFNDTVLAPETRDEMYGEKKVLDEILKDGDLGWAEAGTFALVLPRLKEEGIVATSLMAPSTKIDAISTVLSRLGINMEQVPTEGEGESVGIDLPALFMLGDDNDPRRSHIWFCPDEEAYFEEMAHPHHTKYNPDVQATVSIDKLQSISTTPDTQGQ